MNFDDQVDMAATVGLVKATATSLYEHMIKKLGTKSPISRDLTTLFEMYMVAFGDGEHYSKEEYFHSFMLTEAFGAAMKVAASAVSQLS